MIPNQKTPGADEPQNLVTTFTEAASGNVGDVAGVGDAVTIYVNQKNP